MKNIFIWTLAIVMVAALLPITSIPTALAVTNDTNLNFLAAIDPPTSDSVPISNRAELAAIANNLSGKYHLIADIDLAGGSWTPIGGNRGSRGFGGVFDGQGYVIQNLTIVGAIGINDLSRGLFGETDSNAVIKNVGLERTAIDITKPQNMSGHVGGIVGYNRGTISNSYTTGSISSTASYLGGIAGWNEGPITNCYNIASVHQSSSSGHVSVGGISGTNLNAMGNRLSPNISYCYNAGEITADNAGAFDYVGAISGNNRGNDVWSSYWNIDSAQIVGGIPLTNDEKRGLGCNTGLATSLTSAQMQSQSSFSGWDFTSVWNIIPSENNGYPILRAFFSESEPAPIPQPVAITATPLPANGGTVTGGGSFQPNASVTLRATPNTGWTFDGWFESATRVSTNITFTFAATENRTLEARFVQGETTQEETGNTIQNPHSAWATPELERAIELNLIPASLLQPSVDYRDPITRAEFAAVSVRVYESLSGTSTIPAVNNPFTDTSDLEVLKAYSVGITTGTSANTFSPGTLLNREQAATMLTRVFKRVTLAGWTIQIDAQFALPFTRPAPFADDAQISDYAKDSVYFMSANRIIEGTGNNMFTPRATTSAQQAAGYATATREQALAIAVRMVDNLG